MIKVDQTTFGAGEGNCLTACISTITGIPLAQIPHFCKLYPDGTWYHEMIRWLRPLGLAPWSVTLDGDIPQWFDEQLPDIPWIATGPCLRDQVYPNLMHCCVYIGNQLFHDPHPCRAGLINVVDGTYFLSRDVFKTVVK